MRTYNDTKFFLWGDQSHLSYMEGGYSNGEYGVAAENPAIRPHPLPNTYPPVYPSEEAFFHMTKMGFVFDHAFGDIY